MSNFNRVTPPTLANLTFAERFVVARRRANKTQRETASDLLLTRRTVQEIEAGIRDEEYAQGTIDAVPIPPRVRQFVDLKELRENERCIVARLRTNAPVGAVADMWGKSRQWVNEVESGREDSKALIQFWQI